MTGSCSSHRYSPRMKQKCEAGALERDGRELTKIRSRTPKVIECGKHASETVTQIITKAVTVKNLCQPHPTTNMHLSDAQNDGGPSVYLEASHTRSFLAASALQHGEATA